MTLPQTRSAQTPLFERRGDVFQPCAPAATPWSPQIVHSAPLMALVAMAIEERFAGSEFQPSRLSVDLLRPMPLAPCRIDVRAMHEGRRTTVAEAILFSDGHEVAHASALLMRRSAQSPLEPVGLDPYPPFGPDGLETTTLVPPDFLARFPDGFHANVEVRWASAIGDSRPAAWVRLPMPLVDDIPASPFQRAAALSDLGNTLASTARRRGRAEPPRFINADNSLYLTRSPEGEWLCLQTHLIEEHEGIGLEAVVLYDEEGRVGRSLSARIANAKPREAIATA